jgi:hypothetical protein
VDILSVIAKERKTVAKMAVLKDTTRHFMTQKKTRPKKRRHKRISQNNSAHQPVTA